MTPEKALERLREGNRRFAEGTGNRFAAEEAERRRELVAGQRPPSVILACSDSRVAPAIVFDQGLGDLFVIRVAGNVVAPELLGSIEYAAHVLGASLIVVMGHSGCGAVAATVDAIRAPSPNLTPNLASLVDKIRPGVEAAIAVTGSSDDGSDQGEHRAAVLDRAIEENVRSSMKALRSHSELIDRAAQEGTVVILGAVYSLETGLVTFLDGTG